MDVKRPNRHSNPSQQQKTKRKGRYQLFFRHRNRAVREVLKARIA